MTLPEIHNQIDQIDEKLLDLLEQRMDLALETLPHKKTIENADREREILDRLSSLSKSLPPEAIENIYRAIFLESRRIQAENLDKTNSIS